MLTQLKVIPIGRSSSDVKNHLEVRCYVKLNESMSLQLFYGCAYVKGGKQKHKNGDVIRLSPFSKTNQPFSPGMYQNAKKLISLSIFLTKQNNFIM